MKPSSTYVPESSSELRVDAEEWFDALAYLEHYAELDILTRFNPASGDLAENHRLRIRTANEIAKHVLRLDDPFRDEAKRAGDYLTNQMALHWGYQAKVGPNRNHAGYCFREIRARLTGARYMDVYVETGKYLLDKSDRVSGISKPPSWSKLSEPARYLYAVCAFSLVQEAWTFTITPDHPAIAAYIRAGRSAKGGELAQFTKGLSEALRRALISQDVIACGKDLYLAFAAEGVEKSAGMLATAPHAHGMILVQGEKAVLARKALEQAVGGSTRRCHPSAVRIKRFRLDKPEKWALYSGPALSDRVERPGSVFITQLARQSARELYEADRDAFLSKELVPNPTRKYLDAWHPKARRFYFK